MKTLLLTYFFALAILTSIALPTYISLSENVCEYSLVLEDTDDDSEKPEQTSDTDIKVLHSLQQVPAYHHLTNNKKIVYLSSQYVALFIKVDSPPPEFS
jgi:hypothetical protein